VIDMQKTAENADPDADRDRLLAMLDSVAHLWIERAAPVEIEIARSPRDRDAVYRHRYEVVMEHGWARPQDFPDGIERDHFDDDAIQVVARDGATLVGSSRVVLPVPGRLLPTEEAFDMGIEPAGRVANFDRTLVLAPHRTSDHRILGGVIARSWLEARSGGFSLCCGIVSADMLRRYRELGIELAVLGPARRHWNEDRFPIRFGVELSP